MNRVVKVDKMRMNREQKKGKRIEKKTDDRATVHTYVTVTTTVAY